MKRKLIVNADDFGLTIGVNKGIIEAHVNGILTSTTLMVNTPGFLNAVDLSKLYPNLGVGFHFNLTYGAPLLDPSKVPSLVNKDGRFHPISLKALLSWKTEDVRKELQAQWERIKASNIHITHIDSHHYIQSHPIVRKEMVRLSLEEGLPMRLCLSGRAFLNRCMRASKQEINGAYSTCTDYFIADTYFTKKGRSRLLLHLKQLELGVTEINCHPGYVDEELIALSKWTDKREQELPLLTDPAFIGLLEAEEIELIRYDQLGQSLAKKVVFNNETTLVLN